jgi:hypothetical protein
LQAQVNDPLVLAHAAFGLQLLKPEVHSFTSAQVGPLKPAWQPQL